MADDHSVVGTLRRNEGGMRTVPAVGCRGPRTREIATLGEHVRRHRRDVASTCPPMPSSGSATGSQPRLDSVDAAVSASPPRSIRCSVPWWLKQIQMKSSSPAGCHSHLIRGWPTTECTGSCSCRVPRWWSWRYTPATVWGMRACRPTRAADPIDRRRTRRCRSASRRRRTG